MEKKERILELEKELKITKRENKRKLIQNQIKVCFQEGLEALSLWEGNVPKPVKDYFLGSRKDKPEIHEIVGRGELPPEKCPRCENGIREIPEGISKNTGRHYNRFWVCENPLCDFTYNERKKGRKRYKQNQDLIRISIIIGFGILVVLYLFGLY